jgi:predicted nucleic acid-binding protein
MSVKRYLVDTNILLRFLSGEPAPQAAAASKLFSRAAAGEIILDVSSVIVAETFYTLTGFYGIARTLAAEKLSILLQQHGVKLRDAAQVLSALERLHAANVGFADAFLAAGAAQEKVAVVSFDRDFDKFKEATRYDPAA